MVGYIDEAECEKFGNKIVVSAKFNGSNDSINRFAIFLFIENPLISQTYGIDSSPVSPSTMISIDVSTII
jgi:hypothetical protein